MKVHKIRGSTPGGYNFFYGKVGTAFPYLILKAPRLKITSRNRTLASLLDIYLRIDKRISNHGRNYDDIRKIFCLDYNG